MCRPNPTPVWINSLVKLCLDPRRPAGFETRQVQSLAQTQLVRWRGSQNLRIQKKKCKDLFIDLKGTAKNTAKIICM